MEVTGAPVHEHGARIGRQHQIVARCGVIEAAERPRSVIGEGVVGAVVQLKPAHADVIARAARHLDESHN